MNLLRMILKMTGGAMVFAGGSGFGLWLAGKRKRRIEILRELAQVLILLYGEVEYAAVDMVEIFQKLSGKTCYFRGFFGNMYEGLLRAEDVSLQELWENGIMADKTAGMLDREDVMLWREIGMHLGTLDRQTQLQTLHVLQDRLGRSIQDAETEYQSQAKVYRLVGITGGIFTAILLLESERRRWMSINLIFRIAAVGILVSVLGQVLKHAGREEQAFLVSLSGLILVLLWVIPYILELFRSIQELFTL